MIFIIKKASDQASAEEPEISSITALVELAGGLKYELIVSRNLLKDHPVILVCDGPVEGRRGPAAGADSSRSESHQLRRRACHADLEIEAQRKIIEGRDKPGHDTYLPAHKGFATIRKNTATSAVKAGQPRRNQTRNRR
jgi:hypothetical protein